MAGLAARLVALIAVVVAGCAPGAPGPGIDVDRALGHVAALTAIGPRPANSDASRATVAYLERELAAVGVIADRLPVGDVALPAIEVMGTRYRRAHHERTTDPNLVARFGPPGPPLLVMAHYDTVADSPGAVDNAAAVGVLIELAAVLARDPPPVPILLAFTADEERGLVGAEALAAQRADEIGFAIALDLIGGSGELSLNGASTRIGAAELRWLAAAADRAGVVVRAPPAHRVISRWWPQAERSDHGAFTRRGVRAVHLYHRGQDGEWIDLAYHSPDDLAPRVRRAAVDELGRLLRAIATAPIPAPGGDGFWLPIVSNIVVPRWVLVAIELALAGAALALLIGARTTRARGGLGVGVGAVALAVSVAITVLVERLLAGDHPAPWLHTPRQSVLATTLVLGGTFGAITLLARRVRPWIGAQRYLVVAIVGSLVVGLALLAAGAAELAWIWLLPAALLALAPRLGPARPLGVVAAALPFVLVLAPAQLREAAWNRFLPGWPLAIWITATALPGLAAAAWLVRRRTLGPLGALVLALGCALATISGVIVLAAASPSCSGPDFNKFHLACEREPGMH